MDAPTSSQGGWPFLNMKYQAVFFDLDGTVIDSLRDIADAVNHTMRHFGLREWTAAELRPRLGWGAGTLLRSVMPEGTSEDDVEALLRHYKPYYAVHASDHSRPFDGIVPMMARLRDAGLKLAILSNKPDTAVQPLHDKYFADLSLLSMGERPDIARKPAPDMLAYAADRLGVDLRRTLYVGDSEVDIDTARNTGIDCACVTWGFRTRDELLRAGATVIVDTPEALERYIMK